MAERASAFDARSSAEEMLKWLDPSQESETLVCRSLVQFHEALRWIAAGKTGSYGSAQAFAAAVLRGENDA